MVSGIVSFNGKPLDGGSISFESMQTPVGTQMMIQEGGKYVTDRAPLGKNRVTIETESLKFGNPSAFVKIPAKYGDVNQSGLEVDIKPGENANVNFDLKP